MIWKRWSRSERTQDETASVELETALAPEPFLSAAALDDVAGMKTAGTQARPAFL